MLLVCSSASSAMIHRLCPSWKENKVSILKKKGVTCTRGVVSRRVADSVRCVPPASLCTVSTQPHRAGIVPQDLLHRLWWLLASHFGPANPPVQQQQRKHIMKLALALSALTITLVQASQEPLGTFSPITQVTDHVRFWKGSRRCDRKSEIDWIGYQLTHTPSHTLTHTHILYNRPLLI